MKPRINTKKIFPKHDRIEKQNGKIMKKKSIEEIAKIIYKNNLDLSLKFIIDTLEAKAEIEEGLGEEYKFGIIK